MELKTLQQTDKICELIQRKWDYIMNSDNPMHYRYFKRLWEFIRNNLITNEILVKVTKNPDYNSEMDAHNILTYNWAYFEENNGGTIRDIAAFIKVMDKISGAFPVDEGRRMYNVASWTDLMANLSIHYLEYQRGNSWHFYCHEFYRTFLFPVVEYIQDSIESNIVILQTLRRFKQRCEWFDSIEMYQSFNNDTQKGEYILKRYLFKFLFDQGILFFIEPTSPSGEIDYIASQKSNEKICTEVKVFDPAKSKNKAIIIHGINVQLLNYLNNYDEPIGYFIVFKTGEIDLCLNLNMDQNVNYVTIGNKRIYILIIDIFNYDLSASHRKKPDKVIISDNDFSI